MTAAAPMSSPEPMSARTSAIKATNLERKLQVRLKKLQKTAVAPDALVGRARERSLSAPGPGEAEALTERVYSRQPECLYDCRRLALRLPRGRPREIGKGDAAVCQVEERAEVEQERRGGVGARVGQVGQQEEGGQVRCRDLPRRARRALDRSTDARRPWAHEEAGGAGTSPGAEGTSQQDPGHHGRA
ncbi:uncharacterized protein LOC119590527 [Penaeus monodon]|uniref:uncharacterized protein LOC119590527 n=1 Tax=Penaeus monodon TaxID=6687 RepID=UPI0018A6F062|nr:uncharacterized protein LOC119590527 [Penaeus monodon]